KIMRMHSVTSTIENGFVVLPDKAPWLGEYLHELASFPKGKYDDQADSTSQALDWFKQKSKNCGGVHEALRILEAESKSGKPSQLGPGFGFNRRDALLEWDRRTRFGRF
ncbi:MAG: phage terminase large subunit, partial [Acidobacteriia bacterium]|nr:phage terminase large subunit [Terriglobia bacterium]